ncbi:YutD family protein [Rummeliibacillus pycnus]|uniref:YutD family protein n=1 Tax=Rummeliibacillus pycnus TaxID=101070 RepID=UPI003D2D8A8B
MIIAEQFMYELIDEVKDGFKQEDFNERFSDILSKYDYIVGDWGYGQLRLKGFYEDKNQKASFDTRISTLQDYIYEYCNFGCAYFVLKKIGKMPKTVETLEEEVEEIVTESEDLFSQELSETKQLEGPTLIEEVEQQKNIEQEQC